MLDYYTPQQDPEEEKARLQLLAMAQQYERQRQNYGWRNMPLWQKILLILAGILFFGLGSGANPFGG
jgi:hypothetical protein